jgi:hypothetical protein
VASLVGVGLLGFALVSTGALAIALLMAIILFVAVGLAFAFGASVIAVGLVGLVLFFVLLLAVPMPIGLALLGVIAFLVLVGIILSIGPNPVNVGVPLVALLIVLGLLPFVALALGLISLGIALIAFAAFGLIAVGLALLWIFFSMHRLNMPILGLGGLSNMPAIPFRLLPDVPDTVLKLFSKRKQETAPQNALTTVFTLGAGASARTANGRTFLYGDPDEDDETYTTYSLDAPEQFAMGWTTFDAMDTRSAGLVGEWSMSITDAAEATRQFWPTYARHYVQFGLMPMDKVTTTNGPAYKAAFGSRWTPAMDAMVSAGTLYVIDMTIFASMEPPTSNQPRFTPSTITFLERNPVAKTFTPFLIRVANAAITQDYANGTGVTASTWLYALQAAKTSITCWGIWLGHVYRLHIVTTAMQMTMFQQLPLLHPIRQVLGRQSDYTIGFDLVLLLDWSFPPPTSMTTSIRFLQLIDRFAIGRGFFADDPGVALATQGLVAADFSQPDVSFSEILLAPLAARFNATPPALDPWSAWLLARPVAPPPAVAAMPASLIVQLGAYAGGSDAPLRQAMTDYLNLIVNGPSLAAAGFPPVSPSAETAALLAQAPPLSSAQVRDLNRLLLQDAYPTEILKMDWNLYPAARYLLRLYASSAKYVGTIVDAVYPGGVPVGDALVLADAPLQAWTLASGNPLGGNVGGLPLPVDSTAKLKSVLTSLIYRITAHGIARMSPVGNPTLTFMSNFPPCFEDSRIPDPNDPNGDGSPLTTTQLLAFMPKTGTIGEMISFIFAFSYTEPYVPFIPVPGSNLSGGYDWELHPFVGLPVACDSALQLFRDELSKFIDFYMADSNVNTAPALMNFQPTPAQIHQWELNIET